jgi:hypothetical protein
VRDPLGGRGQRRTELETEGVLKIAFLARAVARADDQSF